MTTSNDDVGQIGQNALAMWAAQAGATANRSTVDARGWDFLVQLASTNAYRSKGPLDRAPTEIASMIQVKTTRSGSTSSRIKLSNWRRMISDPIPWFILFVDLDEQLQPSAAHLVHVDERWQRKVLKRLRELGNVSVETLHQHTIDATFAPEDQLDQPYGQSLVARIRSVVGPDQYTCIEHKMQRYRGIGYENPVRGISVRLHTSNHDELWKGIANLGVGARKTLPGYTGAEVFDTRFGLRGTLADLDKSDGEVEFNAPPVGKAKLRLHDPDDSRASEHECVLYRAGGVFPFLPEQYDKIRLVAEYISFSLPFSLEAVEPAPVFGFEIPMAEVLSLGTLQNLVRTGQLLEGPVDRPLVVSLSGEVSGTAWNFDLPIHRTGVVEGLVQLLRELDDAMIVLSSFELDPNTDIVPANLLAQSSSIALLLNTLKPSLGELKSASFDRVSLGDVFGATTEIALYLPSNVLVAGIGVYGHVTDLKDEDWGQAVTVAEATCIVEKSVLSHAEAEVFDISSLVQRTEARLRDLGCVALNPRSKPAV